MLFYEADCCFSKNSSYKNLRDRLYSSIRQIAFHSLLMCRSCKWDSTVFGTFAGTSVLAFLFCGFRYRMAL